MKNGNHGLGVFGLALLAAFSLMAVGAAAAQAVGEPMPFKINGKTLSGAETETIAATGGPGKFLLPGMGLVIECSGETMQGTLEKEGMAKLTSLYSGCKLEGNKFCTIYPTESDKIAKTNAGNISLTSLALMSLHPAGTPWLFVEGPGETKQLGKFFFAGAGCTLPGEKVIVGSIAFKLPSGFEEKVNCAIQAIPFSEQAKLESLLETQLNFGSVLGGGSAWIDGGEITDAHLTGANTGKPWI